MHTTSQPTLSLPSASVTTTHFFAPPNPPHTSSNTIFSLPPQVTSSPYTAHIPLPRFNTSSYVPPNISINTFETSQSSSAAFPLGPWNVTITQGPLTSIPSSAAVISAPQALSSTASHSYSLPSLTNYFSMPPLGNSQNQPPLQFPTVNTFPRINYLAPIQNQSYSQTGAQPTYVGHGIYSQSMTPTLPPFQPQSSHQQYAQAATPNYLIGK